MAEIDLEGAGMNVSAEEGGLLVWFGSKGTVHGWYCQGSSVQALSEHPEAFWLGKKRISKDRQMIRGSMNGKRLEVNFRYVPRRRNVSGAHARR